MIRDIETDDDSFQSGLPDVFNINFFSYGQKLSESSPLSTLGRYRTTIIDNFFNDPGLLDIWGLVATWTPFVILVVVHSPLKTKTLFSVLRDTFLNLTLGCQDCGRLYQTIGKG